MHRPAVLITALLLPLETASGDAAFAVARDCRTGKFGQFTRGTA